MCAHTMLLAPTAACELLSDSVSEEIYNPVKTSVKILKFEFLN
jgi:hypothetical protein